MFRKEGGTVLSSTKSLGTIHSFHYEVVESVTSVGAHMWNQLCVDVPFLFEWFLTVEETQFLHYATPQHILVYDDHKLVALCPGFILSANRMVNIDKLLFGRWKNTANCIGLSFFPAFVAYAPSNYVSKIYCQNGYTQHEVYGCVRKAIATIRRHKKIHSCLFLGDEEKRKDCDVDQRICGYDYFKIFISYISYFNLEGYNTFDDYLRDLKVTYGKRAIKQYKHDRSCYEKEELYTEEICSVEEIERVEDVLMQLYTRVLKKHGHTVLCKKKFFSTAKKRLNDKLLLTVARKDNDIRGFNLSLIEQKKKGAIYSLFGGFNPEDRKSCIYFNLHFYSLIQYAMERNIHTIYRGRANHEEKVKRGCSLLPWYFFIKPMRITLGIFLLLFSRFITYVHHKEYRKLKN
jgi:predicted N-acyltransferase